MHKNMFVFFVLVLMIFSCKNNDILDNTPDYASGIKNIRHNLEKEKINEFEAYVAAVSFREKHSDNEEGVAEADLYIEELKNSMQEKAQQHFEEEQYEDALRYIKSLKLMGDSNLISYQDIYKELINWADRSSDQFTYINYLEEFGNTGEADLENVYSLLSYFEKKKSFSFFQYYYTQFKNMYPDLESKYPSLQKTYNNFKNYDGKINFEELMSSIVTVILDKGLAVENGMGYFDKSLGTGFFIDDNGYLLTNYHVIKDHVDPEYEGYSAVYVTVHDDPNTEIPAQVVGYDRVFDIALLRIPVKNRGNLTLGRSDDLKLGDTIYTIGNPLGIKYTVTTGILSNKDFTIAFQLGKGFQIDAAINPGNSGGPLIDKRGQVIGIVFAGIPEFEGINFAIPFQWANMSVPDLYKGGEIKRSWVGAGLYEEPNDRVLLYYVLPNGPAYNAGIRKGDYLLEINGKKVTSSEDAQKMVAWNKFPELLKVKIERDGTVIEKLVALEERPYLPVETIFDRDIEKNIITLIFGLELDYYDKNILMNKYIVKKVYKGLYGSMIEVSDVDPVAVYDLKYDEKDHAIYLTLKYKQKEVGIIDRIITLAAYDELHTIL